MTLTDDRLTATEALALLPDGPAIRAARQAAPGVVTVADWPRSEVVGLVHVGECRRAGPLAAAEGFGLTVGLGGLWTWIETRLQEMRPPAAEPVEVARTIWGPVPLTEEIGDAS